MLKEVYKNCFGIAEEKAISFMYLCEDKMVLKITKKKKKRPLKDHSRNGGEVGLGQNNRDKAQRCECTKYMVK